MKRASWEEVANYRAMVDAATDVVLQAWSVGEHRCKATNGLPSKSAGFMSGGISCWDDLEDSVEGYIAKTADAVIQSLVEQHRRMIMAVWTGTVFPEVEDTHVALLEAIIEFEKKAKAKGLL